MTTSKPQRGETARKAVVRSAMLAVIALIAWALGSSEAFTSGLGDTPEKVAAPIVVLIVAGTFWFLLRGGQDRHVVAMLGAELLLVTGSLLGFYRPDDAFAAVVRHHDILLIIVGMATFSAIFSETGALGAAAALIGRLVAGRPRLATVFLCLCTFVLSTVTNNLATILCIVPITLYVFQRVGCQADRVIAAEIVASNLGGAASMIGDFPNMLIAEQTGASFVEFLTHMMPVCLLQLVFLLVVAGTTRWIHDERRIAVSVAEVRAPVLVDGEVARPVLVVLALTIAGIAAAGTLGSSPGLLAATGAVIAFCYYPRPRRLMRKMAFNDALFFVALFLIVGGIEAAGLLGRLEDLLVASGEGRPLLFSLLFSSAAATSVLSAGPATAFLVPTVAALPAHSQTVWWVLSLGVCAGSSATLFAATAGPVAASLTERNPAPGMQPLTARGFAAVGLYAAAAQLLVGSVYIMVIG